MSVYPPLSISFPVSCSLYLVSCFVQNPQWPTDTIIIANFHQGIYGGWPCESTYMLYITTVVILFFSISDSDPIALRYSLDEWHYLWCNSFAFLCCCYFWFQTNIFVFVKHSLVNVLKSESEMMMKWNTTMWNWGMRTV